jgi:uncharacterized protein with PIN domain
VNNPEASRQRSRKFREAGKRVENFRKKQKAQIFQSTTEEENERVEVYRMAAEVMNEIKQNYGQDPFNYSCGKVNKPRLPVPL